MLQVFSMPCGFLEFDTTLFFPNREKGKKFIIPVPSYLITHPKGNVVFDTESRQAFVEGEPQILSAREIAVLELLMRRRGRVVSKKLVEDHIFGVAGEVASNAVEVYIHRLRRMLADSGATVKIHTVRGVGYLMAEEKAE